MGGSEGVIKEKRKKGGIHVVVRWGWNMHSRSERRETIGEFKKNVRGKERRGGHPPGMYTNPRGCHISPVVPFNV